MKKMLTLSLYLFIHLSLYSAGTPEKADFAWGITYRAEAGGQKVLSPDEQEINLAEGGEMGLYLVPLNEDTYIYVLQFDQSGNFNLLYPAKFRKVDFSAQHESLWKLKAQEETEQIYLLCANRRLGELETLIKSLNNTKKESLRSELLYDLRNRVELLLKEQLSLHEILPAPEFFGGVFRGEGSMSRIKDVEFYGYKIKIRH